MTGLFLLLAAAVAAAPEVSTLERWLPSIVTIGGVIATAIVTAFKVGNKFSVHANTLEQLVKELAEQKVALKELDGKVSGISNTQIEQGKDIQHQTAICSERHSKPTGRHRAAEQPGGL